MAKKMVSLLCLLSVFVLFASAPAHAIEVVGQKAIVRIGGYFSDSSGYDAGSGVEFAYQVQPIPFLAAEAAAGYYRADKKAGYISAVPFTLTGKAILPLVVLNLYAGGGVGYYLKTGGKSSELPAEISEWKPGYHGVVGLEIPTAKGMSFLVEGKYVSVDQGKFSQAGIKHGGSFLTGGFAYSF